MRLIALALLMGCLAYADTPSNTTVLDNFNRTEHPLSNAGAWTCPAETGDDVLEITDGATAKGSNSGANTCYWNTTTFGPDADIIVTVPVKPDNNACIALVFITSGQGTSINGYWAEFCTQTGADSWDLYKFTAGAASHIGTGTTNELTAGDNIWLSIRSNSQKMYQGVSGTYTLRTSSTDTTFTGVGRFAMNQENGISRTDNFSGGTASAAAAAAVRRRPIIQ